MKHSITVSLLVYGIISPASAFILNKQLGVSKAEVQAGQRCLKIMGYSPGKIDGLYGEKTLNAMMRWAIERGLLDKPEDVIIAQFGRDCQNAISTQRLNPLQDAQPKTVQYGMDQKQVLDIMGVPNHRYNTISTEMWWIYREPNDDITAIKFSNGIVIKGLTGTTEEWQKVLNKNMGSKQLY